MWVEVKKAVGRASFVSTQLKGRRNWSQQKGTPAKQGSRPAGQPGTRHCPTKLERTLELAGRVRLLVQQRFERRCARCGVVRPCAARCCGQRGTSVFLHAASNHAHVGRLNCNQHRGGAQRSGDCTGAERQGAGQVSACRRVW